jgi:hypothetical protein
MEARQPEKDAAGIFIPAGMDSAIKKKTYQECLRIVKGKNVQA